MRSTNPAAAERIRADFLIQRDISIACGAVWESQPENVKAPDDEFAERAFNIMITPNASSAMAAFELVYRLYMLLKYMEVWLIFRTEIIINIADARHFSGVSDCVGEGLIAAMIVLLLPVTALLAAGRRLPLQESHGNRSR